MADTYLTDALNDPLNVTKDIETNSNHGIHFNSSVWDDLRAPANSINPAGSPTPATVNTDDGSLTFATTNVAVAWFQMPHGYKEGSDIYPHVHWSKTTNAAGTVNWEMKYKWCNIGDVMPGFSALAATTEVVSNSNTADKHAISAIAPIDGTGKTISSVLCIYLVRTAAGDTYAADVNMYYIDVHYEVEYIGSKDEYTL